MHRKIYKEINSINRIGVTLEYNGIQGGDAGHGGFVKINFENIFATCMELNGEDCEKFELLFKGDSERETLLDALKTIVNELENTK